LSLLRAREAVADPTPASRAISASVICGRGEFMLTNY
jgi:hypothetical protein